MTLIKNLQHRDVEVAPATDHTPFDVAAGAVADVPDDLAALLLEQTDNWAEVTPAADDYNPSITTEVSN